MEEDINDLDIDSLEVTGFVKKGSDNVSRSRVIIVHNWFYPIPDAFEIHVIACIR